MPLDLNDPETKSAIEEMIEKATEGLKSKNSELLAKLNKAKKGAEIDPEEYNALLDEKATLESKVNELTKQNKTILSDAEKFKKAYESESGFTQKLLIDNGLTQELLAAGVKKSLLSGAKAMIERMAKVEIEGDNRIAKIGDKDVKSFISEWAASDEGKHYLDAPANSGGGAQGGGGKAEKDLSKYSPTERLTLARENRT